MQIKPVLLFAVLLLGGCGAGDSVSAASLQRLTVAGISAELPGPLDPMNVPIPPEVQAKIVTMENFQKLKGNFMVVVQRVVYTPDIEASLDGALDGSISNIMNAQKMTKVSEQRPPTTVSGIPGKKYSVELSKGGDLYQMQGVIATKGPKLWNVFAFYKKGSSRYPETANKIVDSVQLTP